MLKTENSAKCGRDVGDGVETALVDLVGCRLRRARRASRSKPNPKAVRSRRKADGGKSVEAGDESETGWVNFYGPIRRREAAPPVRCLSYRRAVHLRPPSID